MERSVLLRVAGTISNLAAGHLHDPEHERLAFPAWDIDDDKEFSRGDI